MRFPRYILAYAPPINTYPSQLARGIPRPQMHSNLIQVALLYSILKECRGQAEANRTHCALMTEIQACLEVTFTITKEQRVSLYCI